MPSYHERPTYVIDERIKQLGRSENYAKELLRIAAANKLPPEWPFPDQRCRAAIKSVGK